MSSSKHHDRKAGIRNWNMKKISAKNSSEKKHHWESLLPWELWFFHFKLLPLTLTKHTHTNTHTHTYLWMPLMRAASSMLKLIIVLLYMMTEWLDWMKPMPPMSAARLNTCCTPLVTAKQLSMTRRSTRWNSSQNMSSLMCSFFFQSDATM